MTTKAKPAPKAKPATKASPTTAAAKNAPKLARPSKAPTPTKQTAPKVNVAPATKHLVTKPKASKADKPAKKDKPKKIKMVRDSFTMPETDYALLAELKKNCLQAGLHVKKSELLRAGLLSLSKLPDSLLIKAVAQVEILKTGRPAKR